MVSGHEEIKVQTKNFYANLQSTEHYTGADLKTVVSDVSLPRRDNREILEGQKTYAEAHAAVRALNAAQRPVSDGYSPELYTRFIRDVGHFLVRSVNYGFKK